MMSKLSVLVLVKVMVCSAETPPWGVFGKLNELPGDNVTPTPVPVPARFRLCGLPTPSSDIWRAAVSGPMMDGVKMTEKSHVPPGAMGEFAMHESSCNGAEKSVLFVPVTVTELTLRLPLPTFVSCTFRGGADVPSAKEPKFPTEGAKATQPDVPLPIASVVRKASDSAGDDWQLEQIVWKPFWGLPASG